MEGPRGIEPGHRPQSIFDIDPQTDVIPQPRPTTLELHKVPGFAPTEDGQGTTHVTWIVVLSKTENGMSAVWLKPDQAIAFARAMISNAQEAKSGLEVVRNGHGELHVEDTE